jgi:EF-hand domain pair/EF hand
MLPFPRPPGADTKIDRMRKATPSLLLGAAAAAALLLAAAPTPALAQPGPGTAGPGAATPPGGGRGPDARRGGMMIFEQVDADRDGRVVWEEAWTYVQRRFGEADRDRDGGLTQEELQGALRLGAAGPRGPRAAEYMGAIFRGLDSDRNGRVTLEEIRPMAEARFRAFDANADNAVSRDEVPQGHGRRGPGGGGGGPRGQQPANPG